MSDIIFGSTPNGGYEVYPNGTKKVLAVKINVANGSLVLDKTCGEIIDALENGMVVYAQTKQTVGGAWQISRDYILNVVYNNVDGYTLTGISNRSFHAGTLDIYPTASIG